MVYTKQKNFKSEHKISLTGGWLDEYLPESSGECKFDTIGKTSCTPHIPWILVRSLSVKAAVIARRTLNSFILTKPTTKACWLAMVQPSPFTSDQWSDMLWNFSWAWITSPWIQAPKGKRRSFKDHTGWTAIHSPQLEPRAFVTDLFLTLNVR